MQNDVLESFCASRLARIIGFCCYDNHSIVLYSVHIYCMNERSLRDALDPNLARRKSTHIECSSPGCTHTPLCQLIRNAKHKMHTVEREKKNSKRV